MFTLGFSNLTTFLGVNTAPFAKTVTYPSTTQGRVLRVKDISGTTATAGSLILSTTQGALFDGKVSTLLFSSGTNTFTGITAVADGASNWVIKSAYTDMLVRAPPQPTDVSGLQLWFDANIIRGLTGQQIHWFGNRLSTVTRGRKSNEVFVASAANVGPLLQVSSLNGNNTLLFNNTTYNMRLSTVRTYDTMTFFAVSRLTNVTNARVWQGTQADTRYGYFSGRKNILYMDNWVTDTATNSNITTVNSNWDLLTVNRDVQGNAELFNYGISRGRGIGYMGFQGLSINNGIANEPSTAEFAEWILYNKKLSLAEQQRVEGYLAQKYGFTSQLPLTHPFTTQLASTLGAPSTISNIPNLRLWFDTTQLNASNGQKISSLSNLVGTGEVFGSNNATSTIWPTFSTNQLNGYPILDFANTQILYLQQLRKYPVFTMFAMTRMTPGGATARYLLQGTMYSTWYGYGNNISGSWVKNYYVTDNNIETRGTGHTYTWDLYTFSRNNSGIGRIATFGSNINKGYSQIGFEGLAINTGWDVTNTSACQFAEFLLYDRELSSEECSRVESYLAYKYNQASNLYIPRPAAQNLFLQTPQPVISTISTLSSITNLKFWYDATQIPLTTQHPYKSLKQTTILPSNVSSLDCWYDASGVSNFLTNFSSIVIWYDRGSNARHLAQATQSNQPSYDSGNNRVWFNGAQQHLLFPTVPNVTSNNAFTVFMVEQRQTAGTWIFGGSNTNTNTNLYAGYNTASNYYFGFYNNDVSYYTDYTFSNRYGASNEPYRIWCIRYAPSNRSLYINGTLLPPQGGIAPLTSWLGAAIGRYGGNYYYGYMKEFIIYSNALNDMDRQNVEGYLATKWGLQSNLISYTPVSTMFNLTQIGANMIASNTGDPYWMPQLTYSSINGLNTLHFHCNTSMYQSNINIYPTEFTMFTLSRHSFCNGFSNSRSIFQSQRTPNMYYGYGTNVYGTWVKNYFTNDGNIEIMGTGVDSNWNLHRFQRNSVGIGSLAVWGSNMNKGYVQSGFEGLGIHYNSGNGSTHSNSNFFSDCDIAEIILYDRALDPKEAAQVESYIANKYGLTSNLYVPVLATSNQFVSTPQPIVSTVSTLSDITNLKFWFDPSQLSYLTHPYKTSTASANISSIANISSLDCWFDASGVSNFSTVGSTISAWYDKGPYARHLYQTTQVNMPLYVSSQNLVSFNAGFGHFLNFTTSPNIINNDYTVFLVEQRQAAGTNYLMGGCNANTYQQFWLGYISNVTPPVTYIYQGMYNNELVGTIENFSPRNSQEPYRIWTAQYASNIGVPNSGFRRTLINGLVYASQGYNVDLQTWSNATLGRFFNGGYNYYTGNMKEVIFYNRSLTDAERTRVEGYLAAKWNLVSSLMVQTPVSTLKNLTQLGSDMVVAYGNMCNMPLLVTNPTLGNKNVLRFDINRYLYQASVRIYPSEYTMFTLSRHIAPYNGYTFPGLFSNMNYLTNSRTIFQGQITSALYGYGSALNGYAKNYFTNDGNVEIGGVPADSNWNLHRFQRQADGLTSLWYFGSNVNRGYTQSGFEGLGINYGSYSTSNSYSSDCEVSEILIYDRNLTATECTRVEQYLANKYGLSTVYTQISTPNYASSIVVNISSLSTLPGLKLWFDPSQMTYLQHPYRFSTVGSNFSPSSISSLDTWYDASVSTSISSFGSTIGVWRDIGFYGRHLYQSTVINQPKYLSSATLASNSVYFDGNARFLNMSTTAAITCNDYTVFVVEQRQTSGASYMIGGSNTSNYQSFNMGYTGASNITTDIYNSGLGAVVEAYVDYGNRGGIEPYRIWSVHYSLASNFRYLYINGQLLASNAMVQDITTWWYPAVGRMWNGGLNYYNGYIKEIQFYTTALDVPTRQLMEGYLATKWNLQPSLMSNTPISTLKNLTNIPADLLNNTGQLYNMPFLSTSALLGGKNVMRFDVNKRLFLGYYNSNAVGLPTISPLQYVVYPTEFTLFYIARHIGSNGNNNRIILQGQNTASYFGYTTNKKNYYYLDANIEINGTATNSNWDLWTFVKKRDGMTSIAYFGSNINTGYTQSGFEGMAINMGNDAVNVSDCEVGEILLYDTAFGPSEAAKVETYLATKYNMTSNLFQPYSNVPQQLLTNTVSSLTVPNLKFWYDPTQIPIVNHPYRFSSPGINLSSIPGLDCWFDASGVSNFSTFGSSIAIWYDKGSNGRNLLQSTNINQPSYISSPTSLVNFNANSQFLTFSTIPGVVFSDYTIFLIEQVQTAAGNKMILGGSAGASNFCNLYMGYTSYVNNGTTFYQTRAGIWGTDLGMNVPNLQPRISTEPYRIWSFQYSSNLQLRKLFINGYLQGTNTFFTYDLQSWVGASMGRYVGNYYNGNVKELLIYSNYLGDPQRQQIEGYLGWKWGVQGNLNSNTPVSTIKELTGNGADFILWQGNYCNMPFVSTNPTLGRQILRFDCNTFMYQCNRLLYETEFTMFTLSRHLWSNAQSNSRYIFVGLNQGIYGYGTGANGYAKNFFTNDGNVEVFGSPVDSNWNLHRFQRDSNGQGVVANFGQVINKGYLQSGFEGMGINYGANIDLTYTNTAYNYTSDCEVGEILIYDRALTTSECIQVEQYIATKYNLGAQYTALSTAGFTISSALSTISTLSDITGLKLWFDPSQIPYLQHPYGVSTVGSNFSPSSISSLDGWFDASLSTNFSTVGSTVAVWYDRGPNQKHLYQLISSFQPRLVSSVITGSNSLYFNGANQYMKFNSNAAPALVNSDWTIFALEQRQASYANNYFIGGCNTTNYGNLYMGYSANSNIYTDIYSYGSMQPVVEMYNNRSNLEPFRIWCIQYSYPLRVRKMFINGTLMGCNYMYQDLTSWVSSGIGAYNTNFYTGNLKELMFYTSYIEDNQRQLIEGYLATKWGIQGNLMSNQPVSTLKNLTGMPVDMINTTAQLLYAPSLCNNPTLGNRNVLRFSSAYSNTLFLAPLNSNSPKFLGTTNIINQIYPLQYVIYPTEYTLFYLSRHVGPQSNSRYILQGQTMSAYYGYGNGYNGWCKNYFTNDGVVDQNGINNDSNWNLYSFTKLSNGLATYRYYGSNGNRGYVTSGFEGMAVNTDSNNTSDCEVSEILLYNRALTVSETVRVEQYLANKYALSTTYTQFSTLNYASSIMTAPSTLSSIANLKLWFDPSQLNFMKHPYNVSTVGPSFSPSTISSLDCWFDASVSTNYSTVGSTVAAWYDLGSNRRHLVQLVSTNQPRFVSSQTVASNSIYFNGASQFMTFTTPPNIFYTDYTIMILEQRRSANANLYFLGGSNSNNYQNIQFGYNTASNAYYNVYGTGAIGINIETFSDFGGRQTEPFRIWSITYSSNTQTLRMHMNGHLMTTYYPYYNDMTNWIGASVGLFWNGTAYYYNGNVKELAFFRTALPDDQRQLMEGYIATKWGIQTNLMSNTPISTLYNLTGMNANMVNFTGQLYNMPFLSTSALLGGKNVLRFDIYKTMFLNYINSNTSYTYALQPVEYPIEFTLFYIARHINSNTTWSRLILQGNANGAYYGYNTAQKKGIFALDGYTIEGNGFAANSNWDMWSFTKAQNGMAGIYYFGSNINIGYIGSGFDGMAINTCNDTTNISDCEVGEILLYDRCLSSNERNQVETYLANKYNMTSNLYQPFSNTPQPLLTNVISSLSTIPDLKFWFDPTQIPVVRHPYNFSTPRVNPSTFAGLDCWFDASGVNNFSTFGSSISVWYDKGSNGRNLIQSTLIRMPTYVSSYQSVVYMSSQTAVYLNGSQFMYFSTTPTIVNSDFTIFVVEQRLSNIANNGTNYSCFLGGSNSNAVNCNFNVGYLNNYQNWNTFGYINTNYAIVDYYQNGISQPIPLLARPSLEPYRIWSIQYGSNEKIRKFYVNGFLYTNQTNFTTDIPQWLNASLGLLNSNGNIYYYTGNMKEMIFYSNYMPDSQRQQMEGYLAWKWGIQSNLNSNMPVSTFKNLAGTGADLIAYQGGLCNYPSLIVNPTLGQPVLRFNSNTQLYQCNALFYETDYTFFVLARQLCGPGPTAGPSNTGANCNIKNFIYGLNTGLFGYGSGYNGYAKNIFNADGTIENYGTPPDSNWDLFRFRRDSNGNGSLHYFASNVNKGYLQSGFEGFGINYAYSYTAFNQGYHSDGEIGELIFYNRALSSNECTQVESYIANKYNLGQRLIQYSTPAVYASTTYNTISSLSTIPNLKLWFDPSQMNILQHTYRYSTVGSNFSPSSISSLDAWYDASISTNFTIASGSNISQWYDSTGRGRNLVQRTTSNQPFYMSTVSTVSTAVYFNNSNFLAMSSIVNITSNDYTIFVVEKRQSNSATNYFMGASSSNTTSYGNLFMGYNASNSAYTDLYAYGLGATIEPFSSIPALEPWRIWCVTYSSNQTMRSLFINGHLLNSNFMYQDLLSWSNASIGSFNNGTAYFYTGYIKEMMFFSNALDTPTRQLIEGYLATKWDLQGNLMSNTPVSTLKNLTGIQVDMINTSGQLFNMPILSSSSLLGGKNVMRFTACNLQPLFLGYLNSNTSNIPSLYLTPSLIYPSEYTLFYIARHINSNTTYSRHILNGQTQTAYYGYTSQRKNMFYNDGWIEVNGASPNSNWDLWSFTRSNDGMASFYYFGSNINRGYATSGFEGIAINTDSNIASDCEVGEILVYDRFLVDAERNNVETYLANKYNMTSNLSQPFSNTPQPLLTNVISSLSTIPDLKFWYDTTQIPIVRHPYNFSTPRVNPSTFPGLDCWFDASGASNFNLVASSISIWYDKSSNARHLTQATAASYPKYFSSINAVNLNNKQFMYFTTAPAIVNNAFTIFVVEQNQSTIATNANNYACFLGGSNSNAVNCNFNVGYSNNYQNWNTYGFLNTNYAFIDYYQNGLSQPIPLYTRPSVEPYRIWSIQYSQNLGIRRFYVNGFLYGTQSNFTTNLAQWLNPSLGLYNSNGTSFYYTGNVKEMIFYTTFLDDSQRQQMEGYLASKWGLQSNLNSNTPVSTFKNLAGTGADLIAYQGALCNYPSLVVNPALGRQVLRFNSNTQLYQCNALFYETDYTFFVLARQLCGPGPTAGPSNTGANCNIKNFIYGLNTGLFGYGSGYNGYAKNIFNADGTIENYGTPPDSNWDLFRFRRDSNGNGSLHYFASNVNRGYLQSGFEGFGINYSYAYTAFNQGYHSDGEIAELIFYNRALSSNECTQVENYIANKYNLGQRLSQFSTPLVLNTISSLSTISSLKLWFDPSQMTFLQHAYRYSTVGSNFSPSSISSLDAWYDASISTNFTIASGSNISQWRDSTGRGRTLTQGTTGNQPFYVSTISSISTAVYFNNAQFMPFLTVPNVISNDYTVFAVEQRQSASATNYFMGSATSNTTYYGQFMMGYSASNNVAVDTYGTGLYGTIENFNSQPTRIAEPWRIWCVSYSSNATLRSLYINGQLLNSNFMYQDIISLAGASIGSFNNGTAYFYTGYIKEMMFFSNALDTSTRQLIEGYLATKWDLQGNLMSNTPVSTLKNLTGMQVDMINTSGQLFNMPILSSSSLLGGKNVLRFIGSNTQTLFLGYLNSNTSNIPSLYLTPSLIYPTEFSLFYIARHLGCNTTYSRLILQGQTQTAYFGYNTAQKKNMFYNDGWIELNGASANSNWDLWSFTRSNDGMASFYYFGSNINRGYATSGFEGIAINTPDTTNVSDCEVGEILVYDRFLVDAERNKVEAYLANKYNMTSNLQTQAINYPLSVNAAPAAAPSTLSSITNLKFWFDPGQLPLLQHPYKTSSIIGISPSTISSLECWFDGSGAHNFTLSVSNVSRWIDKTGKGRDLVQGTLGNQPIFSTNRGEVVFNGGQFMTFSITPAITNSDYTIFVVEKRQAASVPNYFIGGSNTTSFTQLYMGYNTASNFYLDHYNNATQLTIDNYTTGGQEPFRLWTMAYSSNLNTRAMYLNGINYMTVPTSNDLLSWTGAAVGRFWNGTTYYYTGTMREIIMYNRYLDTSERTVIEGYLAKRWNLQSNLTTFTPVSTLRNLTGIASDFTAQFASPCQLSNMPILNYNTSIGYNTLLFTATTPIRTMQLCNNLIFPNEYTLFTVSRHTPGINKTIFQSITASNTLYGYGVNPSNSTWVKNYFCNDGAVEVFGNPSNTLWDVHTFHRDSNGIATLFYFGSNFNRGYTQSGFEGLSINYGSYDTTCNSASECEVSEILIYDRALIPSEQRSVERYLTNKYGMSTMYNFYTNANPYTPISTISSISTLQVWLDASQIVASNNASISTVANMTNLGGLFSNNTGGNYPTLLTTYQNNNSILNFTTTQQLWLAPSRIWENFSMFSITRQIGGTNKRVIQGTTGDVAYAYEGGYKNRYYLEQWQQQSMTASDTNWDLNNVIRTSNGFLSTVTWNGSTVTITNPSTFLGLEGIGINYCNTTAASDCQLGELLVYNRPLLYPSEVQAVEAYLATKWATQRFLPVSHPGFLYQLTANNTYTVQASSMSTLCLWLDSAFTSTITTDQTGTTLVRWSDRMGKIASISQATTLYQPNYTTALGPNFCNVDYLDIGQLSSLVVASSFTMLFLERRQSTNTCNMILGGANGTTNNNLQVGYYNTSSFAFSFYNNETTVQVSSFSNTQIEPPRIWSMTYDRQRKYLFMNGGVVSSVQTTTQDLVSYTAPTIGSNAATGTAYNGYLMEMLVYSPALSTPALRLAEGYLAWKWGINSFLAPSHPWYTTQPVLPGSAPPYFTGLWAKFYTQTASPSMDGPTGGGWGTAITGTFTGGPAGTLNSNTPGATSVIHYGNNDGYIPAGNSSYSGIYTGFFYSATSGTIAFQMVTDDGMVIYFNGTNVLQSWTPQGATTYTSGTVTLPAGYTPILSRWQDGGGGGQSILRYSINGGGFTEDGTGRYFYLPSNITQT